MASFPATYRPRLPIPSDPAETIRHLTRELQSVQETLEAVLYLIPQTAIAAPPRPRTGMIRYSMTPWWPVPLQAADRWVIYEASTDAWSYLD